MVRPMVRKGHQGDATLCSGNMRYVKGDGFGHHNSARFKDAPIADVHRSLHDHLQPEAVRCVPRQPVTMIHMQRGHHRRVVLRLSKLINRDAYTLHTALTRNMLEIFGYVSPEFFIVYSQK